ncbi:hypothetical protein [Actinoallomurus sp. CA-150999]|uniref:hypothetical protein n=1 Tax=Actinoallomurus sp. CA-150999 TaxID=3239887 RepID=UPI003D8D4DD9
MVNNTQRMITGTLASVAVLGTVAAIAPSAGAATTAAPKCTTVKHKVVPVPTYKDPYWDFKVCLGTGKDSETKKTYVYAQIVPTFYRNGTDKKGFDFKFPTDHVVLKVWLLHNGKKVGLESEGVGQYVKRYLWTSQRSPLRLNGISTSVWKTKGTWQAAAELDHDVSNDKRGAYKFTGKSPK